MLGPPPAMTRSPGLQPEVISVKRIQGVLSRPDPWVGNSTASTPCLRISTALNDCYPINVFAPVVQILHPTEDPAVLLQAKILFGEDACNVRIPVATQQNGAEDQAFNVLVCRKPDILRDHYPASVRVSGSSPKRGLKPPA